MRILIVEDEIKIASALKRGLEQEGFAVDMLHTGGEGQRYAETEDYDVIVLDRMLPAGVDGLDICQALRAKGITTPILLLTAKDAVYDRVAGLNGGADDYLAKPFAFDELVARVRALLRRPTTTATSLLTYADLSLDPTEKVVKRGDKNISLSQKEFALLEYLIRNPEKLLTKDAIMQHVWNFDADILPNTVEVYIGYLRAKIDRPFADSPTLIRTVRGFGYKLALQ